MKVFVPGGAGYIGSHVVLALANAGHHVTIYDNFCNSSRQVPDRLAELCRQNIEVIEGDLLDSAHLIRSMEKVAPSSVIHLAGLKSVGESNARPLEYYSNNVVGTANLLTAMSQTGVRSVVFSSSATVYSQENSVPLTEDMLLGPSNPYGRTKLHIEEMLRDLASSDERWSIALLRYFNPAGAHPSGRIGEDPVGTPDNLVPFVAQTAMGRHAKVRIYGDDYPTIDGTGVRDYIHVLDLAEGHLAALNYLSRHSGVHAWNLGTGRGTSVLEVIAAFSRAAGRIVPFEMAPRRPGDAAVSFADASAAHRDLGWVATRSLDDMCADHWRWQSANPDGYRTSK